MKTKLTILKEDILKDNYLRSSQCPITKALRRAGFPRLKEGGSEIVVDDQWLNRFVAKTPQELQDKLFAMYIGMGLERFDEDGRISPLEPADFEFEMELPDKYYQPS
jgi:hypothetical protein